jgi:hypothetical protein
MKLLGQSHRAAALYAALVDASRRVDPSSIGPTTLEYWRAAAEG